MADPQSSLPTPAEPASSAGEDTRIEQLLVAGLDHYFAGDFDAAINVWTRVLFLDRQHDRARAYIERARSAQSERQRQTEALVHQGLDAFDRGEVERARTLLHDALDRGASQDLTLGVMGRIERLDVGAPRRLTSPVGPRPRGAAGRVVSTPRPRRLSPAQFWAMTLVLLLGLTAASWWFWTTNSWQALWPTRAAASRMAAIPEVSGPLPVPSVSEAYMRRGQDLFESGRLRDALIEFDRVPVGDPLRPSADEMRAHIQRELLALALGDTARAAPSPPASLGPPPE